MGQLKIFSKWILLTLCLFCSHSAFSQRMVTDIKTTAQVIQNTAMQLAAESQQLTYLDSIRNIQEEISLKSSEIMASKNLYMVSLQNVDGFDTESRYYKTIYKTTIEIGELSSEVITAIKNSSLINKANALYALNDLVMKSSQAVNDYVNLVTNCKVGNPLKNTNSEHINQKKDGANLINRYDRLNLAIRLLGTLNTVKRQMYNLKFMCTSGNWCNLLQHVDKKTLNFVSHGEYLSNKLAKQWKSQIK